MSSLVGIQTKTCVYSRVWIAHLEKFFKCTFSFLNFFASAIKKSQPIAFFFSYLGYNQLRGTLPTEIGQLSSLLYLYLLEPWFCFAQPIQLKQLVSLFQRSHLQPVNRNPSHRDWTAILSSMDVSSLYRSILIVLSPKSFINWSNPFYFSVISTKPSWQETFPQRLDSYPLLNHCMFFFFFFFIYLFFLLPTHSIEENYIFLQFSTLQSVHRSYSLRDWAAILSYRAVFSLPLLIYFYSESFNWGKLFLFLQLPHLQSADRKHSHRDWTAILSSMAVCSLSFF